MFVHNYCLDEISSVNLHKGDTLFSGTKRTKKRKLEDGRYPCDKCEFIAFFLSKLKSHIESKYEEPRYSCDKCENTSATAGNLRKHVESKHKGIRYPCDKYK